MSKRGTGGIPATPWEGLTADWIAVVTRTLMPKKWCVDAGRTRVRRVSPSLQSRELVTNRATKFCFASLVEEVRDLGVWTLLEADFRWKVKFISRCDGKSASFSWRWGRPFD